MGDLLRFVTGSTTVLFFVLAVTGLLAASAVTIYIVAFFQGRSVSFWPPNIGAKPSSTQDGSRPPLPTSEEQAIPILPGGELSLKAGTSIVTAGGKTVITDSNSYTGGQAALIRGRLDSGERVIIKLFWRGLNPRSSAWTTFSREYQASESLNHHNIVRVFDRGLWNGYPFLVSEYMAGGTLYDLIHSRDRISGTEILSIAEQIAAGLDYAHLQGRIHRDIKPGNILLDGDAYGRVAISDFGIARILGAFQTSVTAASPGFEGTPAYVAPEVFTSSPVTASVDIYAFGVVLFEMIAGRCPFREVESVYELFRVKLHQPVPHLNQYRAVPEALNKLLLDTLDPNPERRPKSARGLISGAENMLKAL